MTTAVDDAEHCSVRGVYLRIGRESDTHLGSSSSALPSIRATAGWPTPTISQPG
jgi:hypothetical protein